VHDVPSIDELWESAPGAAEAAPLSGLPPAARRYLDRAVPTETPSAAAVRLRMSGEIKLGRWLPFRAEQVLRRDRQMRWDATARMYGLPVRGFDALAAGHGEMRWKLLGLIPVLTASGPDVTRSAAGRLAAEMLWLPSAFRGDDVEWRTVESGSGSGSGAGQPRRDDGEAAEVSRAGVGGVSHVRARFPVAGEEVELDLAVDPAGRLHGVSLERWGDPDGEGHRYVRFGAVVEGEGTFQGVTIPTRLRAGWYFGEPRFEREGEFFRCTVESAEFR